jgi:predicted metal-dependent phosphoesterase TrpH
MRAAHGQSITTIALTDHDTIDGLDEAQDEADRLGINLIRGTEIDIDLKYIGRGSNTRTKNFTREFHVLGLGLKTPSRSFIELITEIRNGRTRRNLLIIEKMREAGIDADYEELRGMTGGGIVGRPHFARYLIKLGKVQNTREAFEQFLGSGKPFYIHKEGVDFERAAAAIHESGGIAALAHPSTLFMSLKNLTEVAANLKKHGLDGIEAWHPAAATGVCRRLEAIGRTLGMYITAGSDFHGEKRPDRRLGYTGGGRVIDDSFLENSGLGAILGVR